MNFNILLSNKEYTVILRTTTFLFIRIDNQHYIFHSERHEPQCFHLEAFSKIDPITFFENNYAMSQVEILDLKQSELSVNLNFDHESISSIIGKCFRIINFSDVLPEQIINEDAIRFIQDFQVKIPPLKWKFSVEEQFFYFIPHTSFCCKFNSNTFFTYGDRNHQISNGSKNNLFFLNPYTMFEHYKHDFPDFKNDSIYIGRPSEQHKNVLLIIRGTKKELLEALKIICERHQIPLIINHDRIHMHFINTVYDDFHNAHFEKMAQAMRNDYAYLRAHTQWNIDFKNTIRIRPFGTKKTIYSIVDFVNDSTRIQIIIHYMLNELFPSTQTLITTYRSISHFDIDIETEENFEEIPDDVLINHEEDFY